MDLINDKITWANFTDANTLINVLIKLQNLMLMKKAS